jgi:TRL-like protein family
MRTLTLTTAAIAFTLVFAGCTAGILYTHTVTPLTVNQLQTPITETEGRSDIKHIQFSYFGIMWDDAALGNIARAKGMQELYFADLEYLSVLTIWRQYTVHLYGK